MTQNKNFLRNVMDAMIESRMRQAEREMRFYRETYDFTKPRAK